MRHQVDLGQRRKTQSDARLSRRSGTGRGFTRAGHRFDYHDPVRGDVVGSRGEEFELRAQGAQYGQAGRSHNYRSEDFFESCTPEVGAHQSNGLGSRFRHVAADPDGESSMMNTVNPAFARGSVSPASARAEFQDGSLRCPLLQDRDHIRVRGSAKRVLCGGMKFVTRHRAICRLGCEGRA